MKSLIYSAVFLTLCSESQASRTRPHSEWQDQLIQAPILTYEMMEDQGLPFEENWSALTIDDQKWHVHWAYEARGPLKELFPPETYFYQITCIDSSGLKMRSTDSLFATYELAPIPRNTGMDEDRTPLLAKIYSFYLSMDKYCRMGHTYS